MRRIIAIILLVIMCIVFSACSNRTPVETGEDLVYATVIDENYSGSWTQFIHHKVGSIMTMTTIPHPAKYQITVKYQEFEKTFDNRIFYEENHDRVGETVAVKLVYIK